MFDRIAPRYDRLNRLLSMGLDQRWRRRALASIDLGPGDRLIDLACGTGDLAEVAADRGATVWAVDFAGEMLRGGRSRGIEAHWVQGDAERLPFPDGAVDALCCGFALRNFASLPAVLAEMARVLVPGGRLALVEVDRPRHAALRAAHGLYFDRIVPRVGALLSDRDAYRYLPESTVYLPDAKGLRALIEGAGFGAVRKETLLFGAAQLLTARRSGSAAVV